MLLTQSLPQMSTPDLSWMEDETIIMIMGLIKQSQYLRRFP
jgi:hypothetical protein